jgi:hypothetical protein
VIDLEKRTIRYVVRKRVDHAARFQEQNSFQMAITTDNFSSNYFGEAYVRREPFAMLHREVRGGDDSDNESAAGL